jgi:tripartite-type tricarboxylate transporter receptor subunit TctC
VTPTRSLRNPAPALLAGTVALIAVTAGGGVAAQTYPAKPVRVIVPFAPGGGSDIIARQVAHRFNELFGQPFVVENRGGAAGLIGMELTAKAPADGYTIMIMSASFSATPATHRPAFDPINTIVPVAEIGFTPLVLTVHPSLPVKTTKDLIALARKRPGEIVFASPGIGSMTHLATELLLAETKLSMIHAPYKSTGAAMTDLLAGNAPVILGSLLPLMPQFQAGKLRPLAVTTAKRWPALPEVPTLAEVLPGYDVELWFGVMAPRGTPAAAIDILNGAVNKMLLEPAMRKNLDAQGMLPSGGTPAQFGERIRRDYERWRRLVDAIKLKPTD